MWYKVKELKSQGLKKFKLQKSRDLQGNCKQILKDERGSLDTSIRTKEDAKETQPVYEHVKKMLEKHTVFIRSAGRGRG